MCALYLRNRKLHSEAGTRGKDEIKAGIFVFHFCLIPLISEGITGPMTVGRPLRLAGHCLDRVFSGQ